MAERKLRHAGEPRLFRRCDRLVLDESKDDRGDCLRMLTDERAHPLEPEDISEHARGAQDPARLRLEPFEARLRDGEHRFRQVAAVRVDWPAGTAGAATARMSSSR